MPTGLLPGLVSISISQFSLVRRVVPTGLLPGLVSGLGVGFC